MLTGEGEGAIRHSINLGGSLTHLVAHNGMLTVADGKTRRLHQASLSNLVVNGDVGIFTSIDEIPFMTQDLLATEEGLWVATGDALYFIDQEGDVDQLDYAVKRLAPVGVDALERAGILFSDGTRLDNYQFELDGSLTVVHGIVGVPVQRLSTFVSTTTAN